MEDSSMKLLPEQVEPGFICQCSCNVNKYVIIRGQANLKISEKESL
jgi:hypothetical protein